jgi:hypothetical protein
VKWINDALDTLRCLTAHSPFSSVPLVHELKDAHGATVGYIRKLKSQIVDKRMAEATWYATNPSNRDADNWDMYESAALETFVHGLDVLRLASYEPNSETTPIHASAIVDNQVVDAIIVRGQTHENCLAHVENIERIPRHHRLLISQDAYNRQRLPKERNITTSVVEAQQREWKITDPSSAMTHIGFADLLDSIEQAQSSHQLQEMLNACLQP